MGADLHENNQSRSRALTRDLLKKGYVEVLEKKPKYLYRLTAHGVARAKWLMGE